MNIYAGENFQGTDEELEEKIKELESIRHYIINIRPHQYLSTACINRCLYEGHHNYFYKSITSLLCDDLCSKCNNTMCIERNNTRTSIKEPEYLVVCEKCDIYGEYVLKNTKATLNFLENLPRDHCIKNGEISGMPTRDLTDNEYKLHIYKTFVNNSKLEKKYNKLVESIDTDEEIKKNIDNMLVKLWRQMALRH
jgi:hypothetical protein